MTKIKQYWQNVKEGKILRNKPSKKLTEKEIQKAIKLFNEGQTYETIANELKIGISTVRFTIGERLKTFTVPDWTDTAYELREKGLTFEEIGKELGKSRQRIHQVLALRGDNDNRATD